jgi:hypothetical protein
MPVISNDFYATFLAAAKLPLMPKQHTGSTNILPLLQGESLKERALFWHYPHYSNQGGSPGSAVRKGDLKLIRWYQSSKEELFNLRNDIGEHENLMEQEPKMAKSLAKELNKWLKNEKALFPEKKPGLYLLRYLLQ